MEFQRMDSYKPSGFMEILKESIRILSKNGKLMALTATLYLILYSLSFLLNTFSTQPIIYDLILKIFQTASTGSGTPEFSNLLVRIREDIGIYLGLESTFILLSSFLSLFIKTATIFISAASYNDKSVSVKDLMLMVSKSWTRPFITVFYVTLLSFGYMSFFIFHCMIPSLVLFDHPVALISILSVLVVVVIIFSLYLSVVWVLAVVVSVVEESYGLVALGKARGLVKGRILHGFLLNLLLYLLSVVTLMVPLMVRGKQAIIVGLFQVCFICLLSLFQSIAYTVLYFQCKNQKNRSSEYSQVPTAPVIDEDIL